MRDFCPIKRIDHLEFFVKQYCENARLDYRDEGGKRFSFKPSQKLADLAADLHGGGRDGQPVEHDPGQVEHVLGHVAAHAGDGPCADLR